MKISTRIFAFSFLTYPAIWFVSPYVTARFFADIIFFLFLLSLAYQISYIIFFRKKDGKSLGYAISRYFLYVTFALQTIILISYLDMAVNGYTPTSFFGDPIGDTLYGLDAIFTDSWENIMFVPLLIICAIYQVIFSIITKKNANKKTE